MRASRLSAAVHGAWLAPARGRLCAAWGLAMYDRLQGLVVELRRLTGSRFGYVAQDPGVELLDSLIAGTKADVRAVAEQSLEVVPRSCQVAEARVAELGAQPELRRTRSNGEHAKPGNGRLG